MELVKSCIDHCMLRITRASTLNCGVEVPQHKVASLRSPSLNANVLSSLTEVGKHMALSKDTAARSAAVPMGLNAGMQSN